MQIALASPDQQDLKAKITAAVRTSAATQQAIQAADAAERTVNQHRASLASSENAQSPTQSNTLMRTLAQAEEALQKAKEQKAVLSKAQAEKELTACIASFSS